MNWQIELQILGEVAIAIVLGGIIGMEREAANKPAGFRTHMLVAGAAALLTGLGDVLVQRFTAGGTSEIIRTDPVRIIEAIVTGVSFLGAGTIFRRARAEQVEGLTTAASLLFSASVGICVALRQFVLAVGVTLLSLLVLRGVLFVEQKLRK